MLFDRKVQNSEEEQLRKKIYQTANELEKVRLNGPSEQLDAIFFQLNEEINKLISCKNQFNSAKKLKTKSDFKGKSFP